MGHGSALSYTLLLSIIIVSATKASEGDWHANSLTGVESPSHAIRADADASARSATNVVVTLADKYTYDYPVEIIIYLSGVYSPSCLKAIVYG